MALLSLTSISKSYGTGNNSSGRTVLNGISLDIGEGETIAILGPSGSGKSTLLNIIGTLDKPDSGAMLFGGISINTYSEKYLATFRNREIGFIFQSHYLLPQCTVMENVLIPTLPIKDRPFREECHERSIALLKEVGLWEQRNQLPGTLSGGECQRTAVIRALINKPKLLLADEPTGSLDHANGRAVITMMMQLNLEYGTSLIVVTHSEEIAAQMDKAYRLAEGHLEPTSIH